MDSPSVSNHLQVELAQNFHLNLECQNSNEQAEKSLSSLSILPKEIIEKIRDLFLKSFVIDIAKGCAAIIYRSLAKQDICKGPDQWTIEISKKRLTVSAAGGTHLDYNFHAFLYTYLNPEMKDRIYKHERSYLPFIVVINYMDPGSYKIYTNSLFCLKPKLNLGELSTHVSKYTQLTRTDMQLNWLERLGVAYFEDTVNAAYSRKNVNSRDRLTNQRFEEIIETIPMPKLPDGIPDGPLRLENISAQVCNPRSFLDELFKQHILSLTLFHQLIFDQ